MDRHLRPPHFPCARAADVVHLRRALRLPGALALRVHRADALGSHGLWRGHGQAVAALPGGHAVLPPLAAPPWPAGHRATGGLVLAGRWAVDGAGLGLAGQWPGGCSSGAPGGHVARPVALRLRPRHPPTLRPDRRGRRLPDAGRCRLGPLGLRAGHHRLLRGRAVVVVDLPAWLGRHLAPDDAGPGPGRCPHRLDSPAPRATAWPGPPRSLTAPCTPHRTTTPEPMSPFGCSPAPRPAARRPSRWRWPNACARRGPLKSSASTRPCSTARWTLARPNRPP